MSDRLLQVNSAVSIDRAKKQWIDLGIHTDACMTRPENCGAAGGAVSLWLSVPNNCHSGGIVSAVYSAHSGGSSILCWLQHHM